LVHKTIHEAFTNHNKVLVNTIDNVMKEVFFGAPVDQLELSYFNGYNPLAVGSSAEWWTVSAATSIAASRRTSSRSNPASCKEARLSPANSGGQGQMTGGNC
jgi:hypothetical protein